MSTCHHVNEPPENSNKGNKKTYPDPRWTLCLVARPCGGPRTLSKLFSVCPAHTAHTAHTWRPQPPVTLSIRHAALTALSRGREALSQSVDATGGVKT